MFMLVFLMIQNCWRNYVGSSESSFREITKRSVGYLQRKTFNLSEVLKHLILIAPLRFSGMFLFTLIKRASSKIVEHFRCHNIKT